MSVYKKTNEMVCGSNGGKNIRQVEFRIDKALGKHLLSVDNLKIKIYSSESPKTKFVIYDIVINETNEQIQVAIYSRNFINDGMVDYLFYCAFELKYKLK